MLHLEIVTPEKVIFSSEVTMVTIPGVEGYFGVLEKHAQTISSLKHGVVSVDGGRKFFVSGGFAEVTSNRCTILAETAIDLKDFSKQEAETMLQDAKQKLESASNDDSKLLLERNVEIAKSLFDIVV